MILAIAEMRRTPENTSHTTRVKELDWVKGALIVFMVIYHAINYSKYRPLAFEYLAFLPPSFLLITGFIVGQIYSIRYDLRSFRPYLRLGIRGTKLLALFSAMNIGNCVFQQRSIADGFWLFADNAYWIFILGTGRVAIFEVLVPIAYFLLVAPTLLLLRSRFPLLIPAVALMFFCACFTLERSGTVVANLSLLSVGVIGMALGLIPLSAINRWAARFIPAIVLYTCYRSISFAFADSYAVQLFGCVATVLLLYALALHVSSASVAFHQMVEMGNYSLFAYLAQIAILQVALRFAGHPRQWPTVVSWILGTLLLVWGMVVLVDHLRRRFRLLDTAYKLVFA